MFSLCANKDWYLDENNCGLVVESLRKLNWTQQSLIIVYFAEKIYKMPIFVK